MAPEVSCTVRPVRTLAIVWLVSPVVAGCALGSADEGAPPLTSGHDGAPDRDAASPGCGSAVECGDDNPCTDDVCEGGVCLHPPMPAGAPCRDNDLCDGEEACDGAGACAEGEPVKCALAGRCAVSACEPETGRCVETPREGCCTEDADCPASDACHPARCRVEDGLCEATALPECCLADAQCPAGACESPRCDPETHVCRVERQTGCCLADAECPAGDCELPHCDAETHACGTAPAPGCCLADRDCPAGPCERPACDRATHACGAVRVPGCCTVDADCGADERCDAAAHLCFRQPDGCCALDADCGAPDGCFVPRCAGGAECCVLDRVPDCCQIDADCGPGERCEVERLACVPRGIEYAAIVAPAAGSVSACAGAHGPPLRGRVYAVGRTDAPGAGAGLEGELGFGPAGTPPDGPGWTFVPGAFAADVLNGFGQANDDEYVATPFFPAAGDFDLAWRFRMDGGPWHLGDLGPGGSTDGYAAADALHAQVADCPPVEIGFVAFQHPLVTVVACRGQDTPLIFGRVWIDAVTPGPGPGADVSAELGYGVAGTLPDDPNAPLWTWTPATYNGDLLNVFGALNDDEFRAVLSGVPEGEWDLAWRVHSVGGGLAYGDLPPEGSQNGYDPLTTLRLSVQAVCP